MTNIISVYGLSVCVCQQKSKCVCVCVCRACGFGCMKIWVCLCVCVRILSRVLWASVPVCPCPIVACDCFCSHCHWNHHPNRRHHKAHLDLHCTSNHQQPGRLSFHNLALHFLLQRKQLDKWPFSSHTQVSVVVTADEGSSSIQEQPHMKHQSP